MMIRPFSLLVLGAAVLSAPPALAAKVSEAPVAVSEAWVREAPPMATVMGGYMTLKNTGPHALTLKGVKSPHFAEVQMHTMVQDGDRMKMQQVMSFDLPAASELHFVPGGNHLMLMQPKASYRAGTKVPLVLDFGHDGQKKIEVEVKKAGGGMHHH